MSNGSRYCLESCEAPPAGKPPCGNLSNWGAGANILKGLVGLGVLTLPYATEQVGWLVSILGFAVVALMSVQGIFFATMARDALRESAREEPPAEDVNESSRLHAAGTDAGPQEEVRHAMGFFDGAVRQVLGLPVYVIYSLSIAATQITTAISYVDVIQKSVDSYPHTPSRPWTLVLVGAVLAGLSTVKTFTGTSYLSYAGLLTYVVIFMMLIAEAARAGHNGTLGAGTEVWRASGHSLGVWFGVVAFAFGGFPVAVCVHDDMLEPRHFYKVVAVAYFICWLFYTVFALLGYLCYGGEVAQVVYFSFPEGSAQRNCATISIAIVLALTYVVQMMPVFGWLQSFTDGRVHYTIARGACVVLTVAVAYFVDDLVKLMGAGGGIAAGISAFLLPAVVYLRANPEAAWTEYILAAALITLGVIGAVRSMA